MWTYAHTENTRATSTQVWACYADPAAWPCWDHDVAAVITDGPMAVGGQGTLQPVRGPAVRFRFTEVTPQASFTSETRLPLTRMAVAHRIEPLPTGSRIIHEITITGALAPLFALLLGKRVAAGLPGALRALARLAEMTPEPADPSPDR